MKAKTYRQGLIDALNIIKEEALSSECPDLAHEAIRSINRIRAKIAKIKE